MPGSDADAGASPASGESADPTGQPATERRSPAWIFSAYFAEGLPYSIVRQVSPVFFKDAGASLEAVGLTSLFGLPWVLKFLWAPLVDTTGSRRGWVLAMEGLLVLALVGLGLTSGMLSLQVVALALLVMAFLAATHDVAVDGFYLEALSRRQQARYVGYQAMSYRVALMVGGGGVVWLSGHTGWAVAFAGAGGLFLGVFILHMAILPRPATTRPPRHEAQSGLAAWSRAFVDYLEQPRIVQVILFVVLFRLGEAFLHAMGYPLLSEAGVSRAQYGAMYGTFGVMAGIAGAILGGHLIGRFGLRRVIWPLVLAQNIPNLLFAFIAATATGSGEPAAGATLTLLSALVALEALGAGMGTALFMVFIMRTARPDYKAAHMAVATGLMNIASTVAGATSGFLASSMGFTTFFIFTFLATIPGMALVPFLPHLDERPWGA